MGKALDYLGIARMSGNLEIGEENAKSLVKIGKARLLIVALDASEQAKQRAEGYVFGFSTPLLEVPYTKEIISSTVGRPGCSMMAVRDLGLAYSFVNALQNEFGEKYAELAQALREKVARSKARKDKSTNSGNGRK